MRRHALARGWLQPIAVAALRAASWSGVARADPPEPSAPSPPNEPLPMLEGGTTGVRPANPNDVASAPASTIAGQRYLGVFATALSFDGFGLGLRGGSRVGLDVSAGWSPLIATFVPSDSHDIHFKFLSTFQFNASLFVAFYRSGPRSDLGVMLTYKYNSVVKHGVGAAFYAQYDLSQHWALHFFVGPAVFPAAEDHIREAAGWSGSGLISSGLPWLQGGIGGAIAFFP